MKKFLSNFFILFGIICYLFVIYGVYQRTDPNRISFAYTSQKQNQTQLAEKIFPIEISIPKVNIHLPVFSAEIKDQQWEATTKGISYLISSPLPGEYGNSILYGHNWNNLLGPLVFVKPGDTIEITYNNKTKKIFDVEYTVTVTPDQTHILEPSKDRRITVYTCTGFLDSKRYVVVGILRE